MHVATQVDAGRERYGAEQALTLARTVTRIVVARGKKRLQFDMKHAPPDDAELLEALLGPTGNLRAPTLRKGRTLYVGFDSEMYEGLA